MEHRSDRQRSWWECLALGLILLGTVAYEQASTARAADVDELVADVRANPGTQASREALVALARRSIYGDGQARSRLIAEYPRLDPRDLMFLQSWRPGLPGLPKRTPRAQPPERGK